MSKISLDLAKFKHISSDKKSTTLKHADGHHLVISHDSLSPEFQKQLSALKDLPKQAETSVQKQESKVKMADGGSPNMSSAGMSEVAGWARGDKPKPMPPRPASNYDANEKEWPLPSQTSVGKKFIQDASDREAQRQANAPVDTEHEGYQDVPKMAMGGYADGGETVSPAPAKDNSDSDRQQRAHDLSQGAQQSGGMPDLDTLVERVKHAWANGGKVEIHDVYDRYKDRQENPKIEESKKTPPEGPKLDYNQLRREKRKMNIEEASRPPQRKMADGGDPAAEPMPDPSQLQLPIDPRMRPTGPSDAEMDASGGQPILENAMNEGTAAMTSPGQLPWEKVNPAELAATKAHAMADSFGQKEAQANQVAKAADQQAADKMGQQTGMGQMGQDYMAGVNQRLGGIQQEAQAKGALGEVQAKQLEQQISAQQMAASAFQDEYKKLEGERQAHMADIQANLIDPKKYWDDHSKVAAGIGMILAGFNPTSEPNAAINFLNHQIDKNLESQAKNLDARHNLLAANLQQFGNLKDATEMTRNMQKDIIANELLQSASKAASPMARAAAMQAAGQLKMEASTNPLAMKRAVYNLSNSDAPGSEAATDQMIQYARMVSPEMAKEMESRRVPGYGMSASVPVPEKVREQLVAKDTLGRAAQELHQWASTHTTINPMSAEANVGRQKALALQALAREAMLNTVYREGEQPLLDQIIKSNPANILKSVNSLPKLQELMRYNDMTRGELAKHYGLKTPPGQSQSQETPKTEQLSKSKRPMVQIDGKWYYK